MTRPPPRTVPVPPREHPTFLSKAHEFLRSARRELDSGAYNSAALAAVHAVISGGDAYTVARLGLRSRGEGHRDVLGLLTRAGAPGAATAARQAGAVLAVKNLVEYAGTGLDRGAAERAVEGAERFLAWVDRQLGA